MKSFFAFFLLVLTPVTVFAAEDKSPVATGQTLVSLESKPGAVRKEEPGTALVDWEAPPPPAPPAPVRPAAPPVVIPPAPDFVRTASMTMHPEFQIEEEPLSPSVSAAPRASIPPPNARKAE